MISLSIDIAESLSPRGLQLIIFPTEKCNFRCTYCYEKFEVGRMSNELIQGIKKFLEVRIPELDRLVISWFGGEPLLAKEV
ncbi:radical SAM protein, partial [Vibrio parahaemolyticus]|uniref:radical SAM protein n=1 Tax=Vibrio parahaemolyticus TaxID=670 RepID=UPI00112092A1